MFTASFVILKMKDAFLWSIMQKSIFSYYNSFRKSSTDNSLPSLRTAACCFEATEGPLDPRRSLATNGLLGRA